MTTDSLIFLFLDGVGLGPDDPSSNPLASDAYPALADLAGGPWTSDTVGRFPSNEHWLVKPIDANLGLDGLPQSGTGQATLFTGVNCVELAGRHYGPFPHSTSKSVIAEENIFKQLLSAGISATFANAYPGRFFTYVERTNRWTVTTLCCLEAGINLKTGKDLKEGKAVAADVTGAGWPEVLDERYVVSAEEAGRRLAALSETNRFVLFEYFATDKAGHSMDRERAERTLETVDGLVAGISETLDFSRQSLLITSDHGNLEDITIKTHTRNPVPLIVRGPAAAALADVDDLTGVTAGVLQALSL